MTYTRFDVFQTNGVIGGEAEDHDMRIGIRKTAKLVKLFLARCIPERQFHSGTTASRLHHMHIVFKHGRLAIESVRTQSRGEPWTKGVDQDQKRIKGCGQYKNAGEKR